MSRKLRVVEDWTHHTQNLLDENGNEVKGENGSPTLIDDYDNDFPDYIVQDAETGENLETFTSFAEAKKYMDTEGKMRYFKVELQQIVGDIVEGEVDDTGEMLDLPDTIETNETHDLGYVVYELDESGVVIDTIYGYDDIEKIKEDFPADKWQNNNW